MSTFSIEDFQCQIRDAVNRYVKDVVASALAVHNIPVVGDRYRQLMNVTKDIVTVTAKAEAEARIKDIANIAGAMRAVSINIQRPMLCRLLFLLWHITWLSRDKLRDRLIFML